MFTFQKSKTLREGFFCCKIKAVKKDLKLFFMDEKKKFAVQFIDPIKILNQLEIKPESMIADFGCGAGYFSIPLAQMANKGKLYAFDILPQALESVQSKAKIAGLTNIIVQRVNLEKENGSKLDNESMDWIILKDMLFQNKNKEVILKEVYRVLKTGGKVLIVEWNEKENAVGPSIDLRVSKEYLIKLIQAQKFSIEREIAAGNFHYAFLAVK